MYAREKLCACALYICRTEGEKIFTVFFKGFEDGLGETQEVIMLSAGVRCLCMCMLYKNTL